MNKARSGKISILALALSLTVHCGLFGSFAAMKLQEAERPEKALGAVGLAVIEPRIVPPLVTPKPQIRTEPEPVSNVQVVEPMPVVEAEPETPSVKEVYTAPPSDDGQVSMFGNQTPARSVCFVVDCSASMYGRLGLIKHQLKQCIASLQDSQSFYLIFFIDGGLLIETGGGRLLTATGQAKTDAFALIDTIHLQGSAKPRDALEKAFQIRDHGGRPPQLIYFLTDGFDLSSQENVEIMELRKKLAPASEINTIGFLVWPEDQQSLRQMAEQTGGCFTHYE